MADEDVPTLRPVRMPGVRDRLVRHWFAEFRDFISAMPATADFYMPGYIVGRPDAFAAAVCARDVDPRDIDRFCRRIGEGIDDADLYWISEKFGAIATEAAESLPDFDLIPEELPSPNGLMVYDRLAWQNIAIPGRPPLRVDAVSWVTLPNGVWVNIYAAPERLSTVLGVGVSPETIRAKIGYLMVHAPGGGAPFGVDVNQADPGTVMRIVFSTWFLIMQPGVADEELGPVDKTAKRKAQRAGRRYPDVRVINLRPQPAPADQAGQGGRTYGVRWLVRGHWRKLQQLIPGKPRRTYVRMHLKGPDGAPIKAPSPTVRKLS